MSASERDRSYFRRVGEAFEDERLARCQRAARRTPSEKIMECLELSTLFLQGAALRRGGAKLVTDATEEDLEGQASLPRLWRQRHPAAPGS